jgi:membrane fusion protein (multidrug efflux system)
VQSASAAVQTAELNLEFTTVTSLVDGVAAIATAQIGDLVAPATLLTTVSQLDPIKAYFPISEQQYLRMTGRRAGDADAEYLGPRTPLTLVLADGSVYEHRGHLLAVDREIDPKTGTIRLGATFPNPNRTLRPGQYGRVRADTRVADGALLVPQRAVSELQGTYQVRVVGDGEIVSTRNVTVGERVGNRWIVASGLEAGERVVVEGAPTKNGEMVTVKSFAALAE